MVNDVVCLHALTQMSIEMANKLPLPRIQRRHAYSDHLPWVEWYGRCVETIVVDVIAVPMGYVCVKAHIPEVPDGSVINAHFEGRIVREDVAVYLEIVRKSLKFCSDALDLGAYREEVCGYISSHVRFRRVDQLGIPDRMISGPRFRVGR